MGSSAMPREFKLHPRASGATIEVQDLGRTMTAADVAELVCEGHVAAKWVIAKMGPHIGSKPGREWLFYENEARAMWAKMRQPKGLKR
jgi:hypothetical protein